MLVKVEDVLEMVEKKRWHMVYHVGTVRQYTHNKIPGRISITGDLGDDVSPGTLNNIQALLKEKGYWHGISGNIGESAK